MNYTSEMHMLHDFKNGKEKAFEYIFHKYYNTLCLYARNFVDEVKEAEDIAEEAFIRMWGGKRDFQNLLHLKSSLYQTARRIGLNNQMERNRRAKRTDNYVANQDEFQESQLNQIIYVEAMTELHQAIRNLPPKARQIIESTYLEGKSNQEVAHEMAINIQTVKNQKLRALSLLRKSLSKHSYEILVAGLFITENL